MRLNSKAYGLSAPTFLLLAHLTVADHIFENETLLQWPYNLPPQAKYWPEDPPDRRRDLEVIDEETLWEKNPVAVKKMSLDEGEKFYMEYWQFEQTPQLRIREDKGEEEGEEERKEAKLRANISEMIQFRAPFALQIDEMESQVHQGLTARQNKAKNAAAEVLAILENRGFVCPTGTTDCSSIGYPNSCCPTDEACSVIIDTGLGPVGCCPVGSVCSGSVTSCNPPNSACADNLGGGCCIPDYVCAGVGCVPSSSSTSSSASTVVVPQTSTTISTTSNFVFSTPSPTVSTSSIAASTTSAFLFSTPSTTTSPLSTTSSPYTGLQTTLACSPGFQACPVTLGGGCCVTDRVCASLSCVLPSGSTESSTSVSITTSGTTTNTPNAPVRPTSITSASSSTDASATSCPTGFYACSAYYAGGCCRTGRDCDTTSCPTAASTTIVSSGITIVVPVGSAASVGTSSGSCATGWFSCAATDGGNCCPDGYQCGTASCSSISPSSTAVSPKEGPNSGLRVMGIRGYLYGAFALATVLILS